MKAAEGIHTAIATAGLLLVAVAGPLFYNAARETNDLLMAGGMGLFLTTVILYYGSSALHHATESGPWRPRFSVMNSAAGLLLIAGTYTPFCVGPLREAEGMVLLIPEWMLGTLGASLRICGGMRYRLLTTGIRALMVSLGIAWARPFLTATSPEGLLWVLIGGGFYLAGMAWRHFGKESSVTWHVLTLAGTGIHGWTIWRYVLQG